MRAAGATLDKVVEVQVLLARPSDFAGLNEEYAKFFPTDRLDARDRAAMLISESVAFPASIPAAG